MLSSETVERDPLRAALRRKRQTSARGANEARELASGEGWRVVDVICTSGPHDRPYEERHESPSISLVLAGTFLYRSERGPAAMLAPGALLLGNTGDPFECSHEHGEGDRCLSFQFDDELFERVAHAAGARRARFDSPQLPPLRALAAVCARAALAAERRDDFEEIALAVAGAAFDLASRSRSELPRVAGNSDRIARVLRRLESASHEPQPLSELARTAGLSRFHFLRAFRDVTGVTPHQWLLRARLRDAARRLATTRAPVTQIALACGFDDLSNFIRSFRAEFGASPGRYRASA